MASWKGELAVKNCFSAASIGVIQEIYLQTFMKNDLTAINE